MKRKNMSPMFQEQITNLVKSKRFRGTEYAICVNSGSMRIKKSKISDDADINSFKIIGEIKNVEKAYEIAEKFILDFENDKERYDEIIEVFKSIYEVTMSISSYHEMPITKIVLREEKAQIVDAFKIYTRNKIKITVV